MRYTNTWLLYVTVLQTSVTYIIAPQTSSGAKNTKDTKQNKITLTPTNWLQLRKRCKTKPKPKPTVSVSHIMLVCICTVHIQLCTIVVDRTVLRLILQTSITQVLFMRRKVGGGELSATEQWANGWITWDSFFDVVILFLTDSTYVADQRQNGADNVSHMTARWSCIVTSGLHKKVFKCEVMITSLEVSTCRSRRLRLDRVGRTWRE